MKKGSGEPQKWRKIAPPCVPPPEALYELFLPHFTLLLDNFLWKQSLANVE